MYFERLTAVVHSAWSSGPCEYSVVLGRTLYPAITALLLTAFDYPIETLLLPYLFLLNADNSSTLISRVKVSLESRLSAIFVTAPLVMIHLMVYLHITPNMLR